MIGSQKKLSKNNSGDEPSFFSSDQTDMFNDISQRTPIPPHSYPLPIFLFWGIALLSFGANLFISCVWNVPLHLRASDKISAINRHINNKKYFEALFLHQELCAAYPESYARSYGIKIAEVCFVCSHYNKSLFKKGVGYLQERALDEVQFSKLYQKIPIQLKEQYKTLFNVSYYEENGKQKCRFTVNDDKVKLL